MMQGDVVHANSARRAVSIVNEWLVTYIGDRFIAGTPALDTQSDDWLVPIGRLAEVIILAGRRGL